MVMIRWLILQTLYFVEANVGQQVRRYHDDLSYDLETSSMFLVMC